MYLSLGDTAIHRVRVGEVVGFCHNVSLAPRRESLALEVGVHCLFLKGSHHVVGGTALAALVVVTRKEVAPVGAPVSLQERLHSESTGSQHRKPSQECPNTIFFPANDGVYHNAPMVVKTISLYE